MLKLIFVENFKCMRLSWVLCWGERRIMGRGRSHGGVGGGRRERGGATNGLGVYGANSRGVRSGIDPIEVIS